MEKFNQWLTLSANLAVLAGIVFLALEIRQNSEHLALQLEFAQPTQKLFEINRDLMDPDFARVFAKAIQAPSELTLEEGLIAASFVMNTLNEWEDRYLIHEAELVGVVDWQRHIRENIDWTLGNRFAQKVYESNRGAFESEFVEYIDSLLGEVSETGTYLWWTDLQSEIRGESPIGN